MNEQLVTLSQARTAVEYVGSANYQSREYIALEYLARCSQGEIVSINQVAQEWTDRLIAEGGA